MPLASETDVEALIGSIPDGAADTLLILASAVVEDEVGRPLEAEILTGDLYTVRPASPVLFLRRWPVATVDEVREDGTALVAGTDYTVRPDLGVIYRLSSGSPVAWSTAFDGIEVDSTTITPAVARAVTAQLAADAYRARVDAESLPAQMAGLRQLTIGRWSATRETASAGRGVGIRLDDQGVRRLASLRDRRP